MEETNRAQAFSNHPGIFGAKSGNMHLNMMKLPSSFATWIL
jgi:hypothetical protein